MDLSSAFLSNLGLRLLLLQTKLLVAFDMEDSRSDYKQHQTYHMFNIETLGPPIIALNNELQLEVRLF